MVHNGMSCRILVVSTCIVHLLILEARCIENLKRYLASDQLGTELVGVSFYVPSALRTASNLKLKIEVKSPSMIMTVVTSLHITATEFGWLSNSRCSCLQKRKIFRTQDCEDLHTGDHSIA